jgi:hypothetical protein
MKCFGGAFNINAGIAPIVFVDRWQGGNIEGGGVAVGVQFVHQGVGLMEREIV